MPRWRIIDKTLGLDMPEPPETYHTSAHLFADLGIDPAVSGTLPTADRTRVGLGAEVEEDLGGGRRPRRGAAPPVERQARTRTRRHGGSDEAAPASPPPASPTLGASSTEDGESTGRRARTRTRTRRPARVEVTGSPVVEVAADPAAGVSRTDSGVAGSAEKDRDPRNEDRERIGSSGNATAAEAGASRPRRRRRRPNSAAS
jgi:hypothetical protein